jgi:hypothetical protein
MSAPVESLIKKLVVPATLVGLGTSLAFMLVACGEAGLARSTKPRSAPAWRALPAAPVRVDAGLTAVWTGKELLVSGVRFGPTGNFIGSSNVAAAYNPGTRAWRRLARPPKMAGYCHRDAAWTGTQMVVWGCGAVAFNPLSNSWRRLPGAPTGEGLAVWTGRELIGWGGGCCGDAWDGGSAYDPAANTWSTLPRSPLAPEQRPLGAWTGHELILLVSGIQAVDGKPAPAALARAAAYNPETHTWRRLAPPPVSGFRPGSTAAWDGRDLVLVGAGVHWRTVLAYRPATNRWRRLSPAPASLPAAQAHWTGSRLLVWGGAERARAFAYDPDSDRWSALPRPRLRGSEQAAVWTGSHLLVWSNAGGAALTPSRERSSR